MLSATAVVVVVRGLAAVTCAVTRNTTCGGGGGGDSAQTGGSIQERNEKLFHSRCFKITAPGELLPMRELLPFLLVLRLVSCKGTVGCGV